MGKKSCLQEENEFKTVGNWWAKFFHILVVSHFLQMAFWWLNSRTIPLFNFQFHIWRNLKVNLTFFPSRLPNWSLSFIMKKTWRRIVGRFQIFCCASTLLYAGLGHVSFGPRGFSVLLHFFSGPWEEFLITGYDWIARVFLAFFWICFQCLLRIFLPNLFPCSSSLCLYVEETFSLSFRTERSSSDLSKLFV